MGAFDKIEAQEDCEAARLKLEGKTKKTARIMIMLCPHRETQRPPTASGRYIVKCEHSERTPGRECVDFKCPIIDFI